MVANKTKSGAVAVGAPMSLARIVDEATQAYVNGHELLAETEEERNECYVDTVKEAEQLGFRRAFRWRGTSSP